MLNSEIGGRVKQSREEAAMTQEQLAEGIGVSVQYISDMERGKVGASVATIIKICDTLKVSADYILMGRDIDGAPSNIDKRLANLPPEKRVETEQVIHKIINLIGK